MNTIVEKITENENDNMHIIKTAASVIKSGGLVAFPTETVYGLGGDAFDPEAASRIYGAKGRPSDNPLIVHISKTEDVYALAEEVPEKAVALAEEFWPGPLTMIFKKKKCVPETVTGGLDTVAVRLPSDITARRLIAESGTYIAAPSANLSGRPSPTRAEHVINDLSGRIDMIIDGGNIEIGLESTIVDMTENIPVILRPGYITTEMLQEVIGEVRLDRALMTGVGRDVKPKAPGMKYRHYAPKAELTIVEGERDRVLEAINGYIAQASEKKLKTGVMYTSSDGGKINADVKISLGETGDNGEIARNLFAALRSFDDENVDVIYSEAFSEKGFGQAVMNRLLKAAGHRIIKV